jgi:hypothetical protein
VNTISGGIAVLPYDPRKPKEIMSAKNSWSRMAEINDGMLQKWELLKVYCFCWPK